MQTIQKAAETKHSRSFSKKTYACPRISQDFPRVFTLGVPQLFRRSEVLFEHQMHPAAIAEAHDRRIEKEHLVEGLGPPKGFANEG